MLLVDDDEAEAVERGEHRGARADHQIHVAAPDTMPLIVAFAVRERAVLNGDAITERTAKDRGDRRRQRDFRDQHQDLATVFVGADLTCPP